MIWVEYSGQQGGSQHLHCGLHEMRLMGVCRVHTIKKALMVAPSSVGNSMIHFTVTGFSQAQNSWVKTPQLSWPVLWDEVFRVQYDWVSTLDVAPDVMALRCAGCLIGCCPHVTSIINAVLASLLYCPSACWPLW